MKSIGVIPVIFVSALVWSQDCEYPLEPSAPSSRFQLNASDSGVVLDLRTGLSWQRCSVGTEMDDANTDFFEDDNCVLIDNDPQDGIVDLEDFDSENDIALTYSWYEALEFAEEEVGDGWRVPNFKELASLVEYSCTAPAINSHVFPDSAVTEYWSTTPAAFNETSVWTISFFVGADEVATKNSSRYLRLVRD